MKRGLGAALLRCSRKLARPMAIYHEIVTAAHAPHL